MAALADIITSITLACRMMHFEMPSTVAKAQVLTAMTNQGWALNVALPESEIHQAGLSGVKLLNCWQSVTLQGDHIPMIRRGAGVHMTQMTDLQMSR